MESLAKIVDLLKASGWQLAGLAAACLVFWWLGRSGILPGVEGNWLLAPAALGLICAGLALAALASAVQRGVHWLFALAVRGWKRRRFQQKFIADIPHMSQESREILGYLRHYKLKQFEMDDDGGYAANLLGSGYIHFNARGGQSVDMRRVPATVHEAIWPLLEEHADLFPHRPRYSRDTRHSARERIEVQPWRIPWELR